LLAKHKGKPPISATFHFVEGKGKLVWQFNEKGIMGGRKLRISTKYSSIKAMALDRANWIFIVELSSAPILSELVSDGKKGKWTKCKDDFTRGNARLKRFHVAKAHALGLRTLGEAIGYLELFEGEKYAPLVKPSLQLPDIDPG